MSAILPDPVSPTPYIRFAAQTAWPQEDDHRYGLGPIEWTSIFIGTTVATTLIANLTNDLYAKAKQLLLDRKAKGRHRRMGFVIYGPDGKELCRWDTEEGKQNEIESKTSGAVSRTPKHGRT